MAEVATVEADAGNPEPRGTTSGRAGGGRQGQGRARRPVALLVVLAVAIVLVDLVSKLLAVAHLSGRAPVELIPNVLDIRLTRNSGAAFSLAGGATVVLSLVAFVVVVVIVRVARRLRSRWWAVVLGLLAGGAVGNLVDRVFREPSPLRGHVVDWIHLSHWPVFNVADAAISVGAVLAVLLSFWGVGLDGTRTGQTSSSASPATDVDATKAVSVSESVSEPPESDSEPPAPKPEPLYESAGGNSGSDGPPGAESGAGR